MTSMFPDLLEDFKKTDDENAADTVSDNNAAEFKEEMNESIDEPSTQNDSEDEETDENKVQCAICDRKIPELLLQTHMKSYHRKTTGYPCTICGKKFAMAQALHWHHMGHINENSHQSQAPKQRFILPKPTPEEVMENLEAQEKTICPICEKGVPKKTFHLHVDLEHSFPCNCCDIVFATIDERSKHVSNLVAQKKVMQPLPKAKRAPASMEKVKCDICNKEVTRKRLESHKMVYHFKNGKFPCNTCNKRFLTQRDLNRHVVTHRNDPDNTGNEKVSCDVCNKLLTKRRLEDHKIRFHSKYGENYACKNCGAKFVHLADLDVHLSTNCSSGVEQVQQQQQQQEELQLSQEDIIEQLDGTEEMQTDQTIETLIIAVATSEDQLYEDNTENGDITETVIETTPKEEVTT